MVAGHEEAREPAAVTTRGVGHFEVVAPRLREVWIRHDPLAAGVSAVRPRRQRSRFEVLHEDGIHLDRPRCGFPSATTLFESQEGQRGKHHGRYGGATSEG